jgi:hypothetical protein
LKLPNYGLEHASIKVSIAQVYARSKNDLDQALKYAEEAAEESGAEWAMRSATEMATQKGDKAKAALWEERRKERYGR